MKHDVKCLKCGLADRFPISSEELVARWFKEHDCDATKLQSAIQRVRELHDGETGDCQECSKFESGITVEYPCLTIKALEGEK